MISRLSASIFLLILAATAHAGPTYVTYEIDQYSTDNYSASWLHAADDCVDNGPNSDADLYMCGSSSAVSGSITGYYDDGALVVTDGSLMHDGVDYQILSGNLGGSFGDGTASVETLSWFLEIDGLGTFYFEDISLGTDKPNVVGAEELILWGQNYDAYLCDSTDASCDRWGIDLYASKVSVPEPTTLLLLGLGLGLLGMAALRPQRRTSVDSAVAR